MSELLSSEVAGSLERKTISKYKDLGWIVLNIHEGGGLGGGGLIHTKEKCRILAQRCKTRGEMEKRYPAAYRRACVESWVEEIFGNHINGGRKNKPAGYWTESRLQLEVNRYETHKDFNKANPSAYRIASAKGLLNTLFKNHKNQGRTIVAAGTWTNKNVIRKAAAMCTTRMEFHDLFPGAYDAALTNNWLDEVLSHLPSRVPRPKTNFGSQPCKFCGNEIRFDNAREMKMKKFCSRACSNQNGPTSRRWKGGRTRTKGGYISLRIDGISIYEHRYLYENHHKVKLKTTDQIHHINGIRDDNRIENLELRRV